MMRVAQTGLGAPKINYCFGMSQMTVCFERHKRDGEGLTQLEFVEFLEFIGRAAFAKFLGSELEEQLDLSQKIEYILDDILPLAGLRRQDPVIEQQSSVESEDDY